MKLQRKHKMPEISARLIVAAIASAICLSLILTVCMPVPVQAQEHDIMHDHDHHHDHGDDDDDMDMHHHLDMLHHQQHQDFIIGESEERDHIAHHLDLPKFGELLQNVTVPVSREAILQCVVDNLQTYKIAWLRVDTQTILTIQNHVITKNHRMSITHAEKRAWILRIRDVKESDKGWYMCQINTDPMKSQVGYLDVVVPPDILDYPTSTDMVIREGSNVTLKCAATGSPTPTITWRREGGELIPLPNGAEAIAYNGSFLTIAKVNRLNMGAYLCIASNGIPPTVSKRVMLIVHFPPMIWIQNQLVGAALTQNITLECQSEAYPKSINYWMKNDTIIVPGERFVPETFESGYKITMRLNIYEVDIQDFGAYRCVAKNSLGDTDGAIKLYHIPQTTTMTTMAPTASINTVPVVLTKYNKEQRYSSNSNQNTNNNPYNYNPGNSQQNTKQQRNKQPKGGVDQSSSALNNVYLGATSSLWNSQDHQTSSSSSSSSSTSTRQGGGRDHQQQQHQQQQQQQYHAPDHGGNYRAEGKSPHLIKHDAKSLTDDLDRMEDLKSEATQPLLFSLEVLALPLVLCLARLSTWHG
ncbi:cell adhesion molecule 2 isoform X2 [Drosophila obscura]|uniref:cell adhesion molecule 2 isoform X2 n=1 Tax=Drosophila obscura TaxID=7282 RepID=UPI001BB0E80C|nr:cell adhesion molecule 2 isoform X2 [Drosophila obscura]